MKAKKKISWLLVFLLLISTFSGVMPFGTTIAKASDILPAGWSSVALSGTSTPTNNSTIFDEKTGQLKLSTTGGSTSGTEEDVLYAYTSVTGAFEIVAKVVSLTNDSSGNAITSSSSAFIMMRDAEVPTKSDVSAFIRYRPKDTSIPAKVLATVRRATLGASAGTTGNYPSSVNEPYYLKMTRDVDGNISTYYSIDNKATWSVLRSPITDKFTTSTVKIGFAVCGGTVTFEDIQLKQGDTVIFNSNLPKPAAPAAPVMNAPVAGTNKADLSWSSVADAVYYTVKGGTSSGNYTMFYQTPDSTVTTYTYTGLTAGKDYYFAVSATNAGGESVNSTEFKVTPVSVLAFPGAEGGGRFTSGGRGYDVYEVTTLEDYNPADTTQTPIHGSLRDAVSQGNRTIVFKVSGIIDLKARLKILGSNITIAGQTAPGDGICISGYDTQIADSLSNIIIRYIRFRPGDNNISAEPDGIWGRKLKDVIIDHVSSGWSTDESLSFYGNTNFTLQWSIVSESLTMSGHFKGKHGYGGIWGGSNATFHHNILAHHTSRNSRIEVGGNTTPATVDLRNNIIYDWQFNSTYGGDTSSVNIVNNYYKPGPMTLDTVKNRIANPSFPSNWYLSGNYMYGDAAVTADNSLGYQPEPTAGATKLTAPVAMEGISSISTQTAQDAFNSVLAKAGATLPKRDAVDARVAADILNGTGRSINRPYEVGGYPVYNTAAVVPADTDHDGMPDDWETANNLKINDPSDAKTAGSDGYTNLEKYMNSLVNMDYAATNPTVSMTAPTLNSLHATGDSMQISANATASTGATIAKVEFYKNDVKLGEATTAPYSYTWTGIPEGTWNISAKAIDSNGLATQSTPAAIHVNNPAVGSPWTTADIGTPGIKGSASLDSSGVMTIKGAGTILGTTDSFQYVYQALDGDGELSARIDSIANIEQDAGFSGIMLRQDLTADSPYALLGALHVKASSLATPTAIEFIQRAAKGESVSVLGTPSSSATAITYENGLYNISAPYWIKLSRLGNDVSAYVSADGAIWSYLGTRTFASLPSSLYLGFAEDAGKALNSINNYNYAKFSNISFKNTTTVVPGVVVTTPLPETTDSADFTVTGHSNVGAKITIKVNDVVVLDNLSKAADEEFTKDITFKEGANLIEISATDSENNKRTYIYNTVYTPKSSGGTVINNRKIDVWDFGGVQTSGSLYNNVISKSSYGNPGTLDGLTTVGPNSSTTTAGLFTGTTAFGDLSIVTVNGKNDRLYYYTTDKDGNPILGPKSITSPWNNANKTYPDGYISNGTYYCNGSTSSTARYLTIDNVVAGDKISVYGGLSANGPETIYLTYTGTAGVQNTPAAFTGDVSKIDFVAQYSGSYKINVSAAKSGKPYFHRVVRTPGVIVNGKVNFGSVDKTGISLTFKNQTTSDLTDVSINADGTFSTVLAPGYAYTAALKGTIAYAVSDATKVVTTTTTEFPYGKNDVNLEVVENKISTVSGKINGFDSGYNVSKLNITFTPPADSLADAVTANIDSANMTFTAVVKQGQEYTAVISGVNDYEIISGGNINVSADTTSDITVAKKPVYKASGNFTGLSSTAVIKSITFTNVDDSYTYSGTIADGGYTADLRDGSYIVSAVCSENYITTTHIVVNDSDSIKDIKFNEVNGWNLTKVTSTDIAAGSYNGLTLVNGTGSFGTHGGDSITAKPGSSIVIPVKEGQLVTVSGWYSGVISFSEDPTNIVTITKDTTASKPAKLTYKTTAAGTLTLNITGTDTAYLTAIDRVQQLDWVSDLYVGDSSKPNNYSTVKDAVEAAAKMNPTSEAQRITIHIAPGIYRAQLKISTPYITFASTDPTKEVKITSYYGIGYKYYSMGSDGYYNADSAFDKYSKNIASKWGATVFLTSSATAFRAENIVFENSFNKYVTDEELKDGVELAHIPDSSINVERTASMDVTSKPATERAAAMGIEANNVEFYNCSFLSSQDTLYTGGDGTFSQYYKNCYIEGNTDYIFGDGNVVFDNCNLNFFGYSNAAVGGYITAAKDTAKEGYLFRNSTITANVNNYQSPGYFGRPWSKLAHVTFMNSKLQSDTMIDPAGWKDMSGNLPENANFKEYNTTYNGSKVDTALRKGNVLTDIDAAAIDVTKYFGTWTPAYYASPLVADTVQPSWTDGKLDSSNITTAGLILNWNIASDNVRVVGYKVYQDTTLLATVAGYVYNVTGLEPNTAYTFKVQAVDAYGNESEAGPVKTVTTLAVPVTDTTAPVITLVGDATVDIDEDSQYTDKGATALDNIDGDITSKIVTVNPVNTSVTGTYTVTYDVSDTAGNKAVQVTRTVNVTKDHHHTTPSNNNNPTSPVNSDGSTVVGSTINTASKLDSNTATAKTEVSSDALTAALANATPDSKGVRTVEINVAKVEGAKAYEQVLPATSLGQTTKDVKFVVNTPVADIVAPGNVLSSAVLTSGSVANFSVGSVDTGKIADAALAGIIGSRPAISFEVKVDGKSVSGALNGSLKITIPYTATAEEAEKLTVVKINADGTSTKIGASIYSKTEGGVSFKSSESGTYAVVYDPKSFSDLASYDWAKKQVEVLASKGVINGTSASTFSPSDNITRADFIMMLVKTLDLKAPASADNFADVKSSAYYSNALAIAKKLGIAQGTGDNKFNPNEQISRQDMMVICERALKLSEMISSQANSKDIEKYHDSSLVSNYAVNGVSTMVAEGIVTGDANNLNPLGNASRAETAVIMYRILMKN